MTAQLNHGVRNQCNLASKSIPALDLCCMLPLHNVQKYTQAACTDRLRVTPGRKSGCKVHESSEGCPRLLLMQMVGAECAVCIFLHFFALF